MSGPEGDQHRGFWEIGRGPASAPARLPRRLRQRGRHAESELPMTTMRVTVEEIGGGKTRMSIESECPTVEAMEQLAPMWGLKQTVGQIDAILAEDPAEAGGGRR